MGCTTSNQQQVYALIFLEQTILKWIRPRAHEADGLQLQPLAGGAGVLCAQQPSHRFLHIPSVRPVSLIMVITVAVKNLRFCQAQVLTSDLTLKCMSWFPCSAEYL